MSGHQPELDGHETPSPLGVLDPLLAATAALLVFAAALVLLITD